MGNQQDRVRSVAWAWAVAWFLVAAGQMISDVYSTPNRGLVGAYVFGLLGWAVGGAATIRYMRQRFGADVYMVALNAGGWGVGAVVAVVLGLVWLDEWSPGFWGPIWSATIGGAIGGALTIPRRSFSSRASVLRASLTGALCWGVAFLAFQVLAFYAGYILMQMTVDPLVPLVGHIGAEIPGWAVPAGVGGFLAGRLAVRSPHLMDRPAAV